MWRLGSAIAERRLSVRVDIRAPRLARDPGIDRALVPASCWAGHQVGVLPGPVAGLVAPGRGWPPAGCQILAGGRWVGTWLRGGGKFPGIPRAKPLAWAGLGAGVWAG